MANCISSMLRHEMAIQSICSATRKIDATQDCGQTTVSGLTPNGQPGKRPLISHGLPRFGAVGFFCSPDAWNMDDPSLPFRTQTLL